jgi:hypothetical protein
MATIYINAGLKVLSVAHVGKRLLLTYMTLKPVHTFPVSHNEVKDKAVQD